MYSFLIVLSVTSFWFLSPETFVLTGNGGGLGAGLGIVALVGFSLITFFGSLFAEGGSRQETGNDSPLQKQGTDFIGLIGIAGMIGTTSFASTGILVTAGFTFNEVFYYRFPNFAFAFILLITAFGLHFSSSRMKNFILVITCSSTFAGLAVLIGLGLMSEPKVPLQFAAKNVSFMGLLPLLLVFIGIDRIRASLKEESVHFRTAFFLSVLFLVSWLTVSARFVEPQKLLFSTIPYMTAAAKIGGEPGRLIMGMIIIFGSIGAVHGLMKISSSSVSILPGTRQGDSIGKGIMLLLAIGIGGMMAGGVAGTKDLELYIRSSLSLWMVYSALNNLSGAFREIKKETFKAAVGISCSLIILLGSLAMFFDQDHLTAAAAFTVFMIAGALLLVTFLNVISGYHETDDVGTIKNTEV